MGSIVNAMRWIMLVSEVLTFTMVYAAISRGAAIDVR